MESISLSSKSSTTVTTTTADPPVAATSSEDILSLRSTTTTTGGQESIAVERRSEFAAVCKWTVANFGRIEALALWSEYFQVGGFDCRLLIDSQALPGYVSIYLQIVDPTKSSSSEWECFTSCRSSLVNVVDDSKSVNRDSWHRFSSKKHSHGWCDFTPSNVASDSKLGFVFNGDSILIMADILILDESVIFTRDNHVSVSGSVGNGGYSKFTWKVHNFSLFKEMIKTQKITRPVFPAGECNLRISVYQREVNGVVEYLSMCLESEDTEKSGGGTSMVVGERSCWRLFKMSVLNQKPGLNHMQRDSYGRFAADNTSLGWNDYVKMLDFVGPEAGFLMDDTAVFSTSFHVIKEFSNFSTLEARIGSGGSRKSDGLSGKFTWSIDNFTR